MRPLYLPNLSVFSAIVSAAIIIAAAGTALPTASAEAANVKEVEINLKKYCYSRKLVFAGWSNKRKSFVCGEQHTRFNTYYLKNFAKINLTRVCKQLANTSKWRYRGN